VSDNGKSWSDEIMVDGGGKNLMLLLAVRV